MGQIGGVFAMRQAIDAARNRRTGIPLNERTLQALVLEASRLGVGNALEP